MGKPSSIKDKVRRRVARPSRWYHASSTWTARCPLLHRVPLRFVPPRAFYGWPPTSEIVLPRIPTYLLGLTSPSPRWLPAKRIKIVERSYEIILRDRTYIFLACRQIFVLNNSHSKFLTNCYRRKARRFRQKSPTCYCKNIKDTWYRSQIREMMIKDY